MTWLSQLNGDPLPWLLDPAAPNVRYLTLRDLLERPQNDPELIAARTAAHTQGPIAHILEKMNPEGFWSKAGPGYSPKYRSTVWALLLLAQLGASVAEDERLQRACDYLFEQAYSAGGQFSHSSAPSGTIECLQGNLCWALAEMGCQDARLENAFDWLARCVTGDGIAPVNDRQAAVRYYAYKCGPGFICGANNKMPCAWAAAKVMLALSQRAHPPQTPQIEAAIRQGVDFLFSTDPAKADYPCGYSAKPSGDWWKFGFPVFYITDILQLAEALVGLGYAKDPRLANTLALIREKQDASGRWPLEFSYPEKTWGNYGEKKQPNPWVTLRALRVLKAADTQ